MRMPRPLYEGLPWLYMLTGGLALGLGFRLQHAGSLSTPLSIIGWLLVIAGAVIWLRRRNYRAIEREYSSPDRAPNDEGI